MEDDSISLIPEYSTHEKYVGNAQVMAVLCNYLIGLITAILGSSLATPPVLSGCFLPFSHEAPTQVGVD